MITILTGLVQEADIARSITGATVLCGRRARDNLKSLVPDGTEVLVSFGVCGGLDPCLRVGDLFVVSRRIQEFMPCVTGPHYGGVLPSNTPQQRAWLFKKFGARVADDESWHVIEQAVAKGIPYAIVRAVSDDAFETLPPAALVPAHPDGSTDLFGVMASMLKCPSQIFAMNKVASDFQVALGSLRRARDAMVDLL